MGAKTKGLCELVQVTKRNFFRKSGQLIERKEYVCISGLFMFIQRFLPIKGYLWIINRKEVKSCWNNFFYWDSPHAKLNSDCEAVIVGLHP